jgi:hypothetical protein
LPAILFNRGLISRIKNPKNSKTKTADNPICKWTYEPNGHVSNKVQVVKKIHEKN